MFEFIHIKSGLVAIVKNEEQLTFGALLVTDKDNNIKDIKSVTLEDTDKIYFAECPEFKVQCSCGNKFIHFHAPSSDTFVGRGLVDLTLAADDILKYCADNLSTLELIEYIKPKEVLIAISSKRDDILEFTNIILKDSPLEGLSSLIKKIITDKDLSEDILNSMKPSKDTSNPNIN